MAIKRRAAAESDTEAGGSQLAKRVRTGDESDGEANEVGGTTSGRSARNKQQLGDGVEVVEEDDEDMQEEAPDADEEKRFEQEHEDAIREKVFNKGNKGQGNIAEMGIIEKLEMHNFMCHKYLVFHFGPQINFIIGHNGSGKSAVLTALTIALGGKANITGRGSGLKSFIKEGEDVSEITVTIKNQGEDAYKPKVYGESILIRRQFSKTGSSSYKIMAKNEKVISTKREELSNICDHLNIQVDNPMNILTQDSARQFLSASQPADKYKFFLKGTQLSQLSEEYSTCMENIVQTQKVLKNKSEIIPDLEEALRDATQRFKEADKARQQKHKADELKKELAWAHVATKREEYEEKLREVEKQKKRVKKVKSSLEEAEIKKTEAEKAVVEREQEIEQFGTLEHLEQRKKELSDEIKAIKAQLSTLQSEEVEMNHDVNFKNNIIGTLKTRMAAEAERLEKASQGARDALIRNLAAAEQAFEEGEALLRQMTEEIRRKGPELNETKARGQAIEQQLKGVVSQVEAAKAQLKLIADRERTKLAPFGMNLDQVLAEIPRLRWYGQNPVGPLGQFVKARDMRWAPLLRARLGGAMGMFAVTDARDRQQLDALLKRYGNTRPNIVISEVDLFDYSRGEPPAEFTTLLRVLNISDEYVLRILINSFNIESILVADTRADADRQLQRLGRGTAWTMDFYTVQRFPEGGGQSSLATQLRPNDPRQQTFTSDDLSAQRQRFQEQYHEADTNRRHLEEELAEVQKAYRIDHQALITLTGRKTEQERLVRTLRVRRDSLQADVNEDLPMSMQTLQEELKEAEESKETTLLQFKELQDRMNRMKKSLEPLQEEMQRLRAQIGNHQQQRGAIEKTVEEAMVQRLAAQNSVVHWEKKLDEENAKVATLQEVADQLEEEFKQWTGKAKEYCDEWPEPRKVAEVQRNLEAIQRALQDRERRQGATVEQMIAEVNKRKAALDGAKKDLKLMMQLNKSLRKSIRVRVHRWHEFRRHIALRCKIYFQYHLSNRGYFGKVLFDHIDGTLQLRVQTDDQVATQAGSREKDPNALSGGEKSFSTICLLLSLWESIGCPIRCLDEFDVFMDAVNRRISMKMMIDTANASDRKQYILITPQDMNNVHIGATVRVHRMTDPERGQNTLAFN